MASLRLRTVSWLGLGLYSLVLVAIEAGGRADLARHLCSDIAGPIRFWAVNTSLSVGLLLGSALLLLFTAATQPQLPRRERRFRWLQALVFAYLAFDDRFMVHESLGVLLHIEDAFVLVVVGVLELVLLWRYGALRTRSPRARRYLILASFAFAAMSFIDAFFNDAHGIPRLTLEDGSKAWCAAFLFAFAWEVSAEAVAVPQTLARSSAA